MSTRLIKWVVIIGLFIASNWLTWQWSEARTEARAAEARTEAVAEAQRDARAKMQASIDEQRERARQHAKRVEKLRGEVNELEETASEYASSEAGQQECLGDPGREAWNDL